jgi:hypothetical protein
LFLSTLLSNSYRKGLEKEEFPYLCFLVRDFRAKVTVKGVEATLDEFFRHLLTDTGDKFDTERQVFPLFPPLSSLYSLSPSLSLLSHLSLLSSSVLSILSPPSLLLSLPLPLSLYIIPSLFPLSLSLSPLFSFLSPLYLTFMQLIRQSFPRRKMFTTPAPPEELIEHLGTHTDLPEGKFKEEIERLQAWIQSDDVLKAKRVGGSEREGSVVVAFLEECVKAINEGENVMIPSVMETTMDTICSRRAESALRVYKFGMVQIVEVHEKNNNDKIN